RVGARPPRRCGLRPRSSLRHGYVEKRALAGAAQLVGLEEPDDPVLAVVAGDALDPAGPQPPDRLAEPLAAGAGDLIDRCRPEDVQLRPERRDERVELGVDRLRLRPDATALAEDLGELNEVVDDRRGGRRVAVRSIGQLLDPVQHADGERLAALRAAAAGLPGLRGCPVDPAGPVPVGVVLALLRKELDRPLQAVAGA